MTNKILTISFPALANYTVHIEFTRDIKKTVTQYPETRSYRVSPTIAALMINVKHDAKSFVFLPVNPPAGLIAHECWHVVRRMMKYLGIKIGNEVAAYHLAYLVEKVTKFIRRPK